MKRVTLIAFFVLPILVLASYVCYEDHEAREIKAQMRTEEELVVQQAIHQYTIHEGKPPKSLMTSSQQATFAEYPENGGAMIFRPPRLL